MSNVYTLKITLLETRQMQNIFGIVTVVHFEYIGTSISGETAKVSGNCNLYFSEDDTLIPLEQLDEMTVSGWVINHLGRGVFENYERILQEKLQSANSVTFNIWTQH